MLQNILKIISLMFFSMILQSSYAQNQRPAILLNIQGAIGPATQDFIHRGLQLAVDKHSPVVILQIDTPGGLDKSMRGIIQDILASSVPIVSYVAPSGARAASAGTYILYASHIAAMAPGTELGAATPVEIGAPAVMPEQKPTDDNDKQKKIEPKDTMTAKMTNDAVAYIRSLAELRERNADWAEKAVRESASLSASKALQEKVINLIASNTNDLLQKINGSQVSVQGNNMVLQTAGLSILEIKPDWRTRFLSVITDPSVAYILLIIGIYGLFFEFYSPGFILPGVAGAISLLLALYAFQLLPINYAGLALIFLGITFLAAETFIPSGALGLGGLLAFIVGSILLLDTEMKAFSINWYLIILMAVLNAAFFIGMIGMVMRARKRKIVSGTEELMHMEGVAEEAFNKEGWIKIHSERWRAVSNYPIKQGEKIKVIGIEGLILKIESSEKNTQQ